MINLQPESVEPGSLGGITQVTQDPNERAYFVAHVFYDTWGTESTLVQPVELASHAELANFINRLIDDPYIECVTITKAGPY